MERKPVVIGLDGIVWSNKGKDCLYMLAFQRMVAKRLIPIEYDQGATEKHDVLRAIGKGVEGRPTSEIEPIIQGASQNCVNNIHDRFVDRLRRISPSRYQLIAMSSAPDFMVKKATRMIERKTGIPFSPNVLASTYSVEDGVYSGRYRALDKGKAVASMLSELGLSTVEEAYVNGMSDLDWSSRYSRTTVVVNPGKSLEGVVSSNPQPNIHVMIAD